MPEDDLMAVVYKAFRDEEFFNALVKNVDAALEKAQISLSPEDTTALKSTLQSPPTRIDFDLPAFLRGAHARGLVDFRWLGFGWVTFKPKPKP